MSTHDAHAPSREEVLVGIDRPTPPILKTIALVLAGLGLIVFVIGLFVDPDRVWQALLVNWLYFTSISSAGVMFVAVQRITTARWSRPIIRFLEGYVAFLPVAFVLLLILLVGRHHIFWWSNHVPDIPEKRVWLNPPFFFTRVIVVYLIITLLSLWYIYTSVRLDVGILPESGAKWARGLRERMRRGYRDERRELHSTHSLQGKLAVFLGFRVRVRVDPVVVGSLDVARPALPEHDVRLVVLHGSMGHRARQLDADRHGVAQIPRALRSDSGQALPRSGQALLRVHRVLGLPHLRAVPGDLVRQPRRGDALDAAAADRRLAHSDADHRRPDVRPSVLRAALARGESFSPDDGSSSRRRRCLVSGCTVTSRSILRSTVSSATSRLASGSSASPRACWASGAFAISRSWMHSRACASCS